MRLGHISPWLHFGAYLTMWLGGVATWAIVLDGALWLLTLGELWFAPRCRQPLSSLPPDSTSSKFGKILNEYVRELHTPETESDIEIDVIFFHGLDFGDARDAQSREWLSRSGTECWPQKWLPEEFPAARILSVSYDANVWENDGLDMRLTTENLVYSLIMSNSVGEGWNRPLVLVGHCVGGLILKRLCLDAVHQLKNTRRSHVEKKKLGNFLSSLRGVFYYSTPHGGSEAAQMLDGSRRTGRFVDCLELLNKDAISLQQKFQGLRDQYKGAWEVASVFELEATRMDGFCGVVVGEASAKVGIGYGNTYSVKENHFTVNQPKDQQSASYIYLVAFLSQILQKEKQKVESFSLLQLCHEETVGLEAKVEDIQKKLETTTSLGLYGIGGVGKTTVARAVFKALCLSEQFEYTCFIMDVKDLVKRESGQQLTSRMLEDLKYCGRKLSRKDADWFTLKGRKVLLVIDDVDCKHQLQDIPWSAGWFRADSRVIATSRDQKFCDHLFQGTYEVERLSKDDSQQLFIRHAFEGDEVPSFLTGGEDYLEKILYACGGVPLALEVVGKSLHKETDEEIWVGALERLEKGQPVDGDFHNRLSQLAAHKV